MTCKEYRDIATLKCSPNSGILALIFLIYFAITSVTSFSMDTSDIKDETILLIILFMTIISSAIGLFIMGQMNYGLHYVIKENYEESKPQVKNLFIGFNNYWKCFLINLLQGVYILLWSLLFIIPGIIKSIAYSMAYFVSIDNPELSANECITRSKEMMVGYKGKSFAIAFSYLGWLILCVLTLGIIIFWVSPKMYTAQYELYRQIKEKQSW